MYRSISYNLDENHNGQITLLTWDEKGNRITETHPHESYLYEINSKGSDGISMFGDPLLKKEFRNIFDRKKYIQTKPLGTRLFDYYNPTKEFLLKAFEGKNLEKNFNQYPLRTFYLDIEIQVSDLFPDPEKAAFPINIINIFDSFDQKFHLFYFGSEVYESNDSYWSDCKFPVVFHHYKTELALLSGFTNWFSKNFPDIITTWNGIRFDIPYIFNRLYNCFCTSEEDKEEINKKMSPLGKVIKRMQQVRSNGKSEEYTSFKIEGVSHLDYMVLYRDKFPGPQKLNSYSLGSVGEYEFNLGKLEYEGSIKDFYKRDFKKFVKYNIRDVEILVLLEEKTQLLELTRTSCTQALVEFENIYTSSGITVGNLAQFAHRNNLILMTSNGIEDKPELDYPGAFVFPTIAGCYREGLTFYDINSLYPNIMITCNISPETKLGKILPPDENGISILKLSNGKVYEMNQEQAKQLKSKCIHTPNGILYCKQSKKVGLIPKICSEYYQERKNIQKILKGKKNSIEIITIKTNIIKVIC